ncbi:hypothetical protein F4778DRAFT_14952 [Xylariomycetidae sp. FL2044]|nr:hypothetical protein F4778DRAFT_14952 [Xylariomycetidae sp. FL2044]
MKAWFLFLRDTNKSLGISIPVIITPGEEHDTDQSLAEAQQDFLDDSGAKPRGLLGSPLFESSKPRVKDVASMPIGSDEEVSVEDTTFSIGQSDNEGTSSSIPASPNSRYSSDEHPTQHTAFYLPFPDGSQTLGPAGVTFAEDIATLIDESHSDQPSLEGPDLRIAQESIRGSGTENIPRRTSYTPTFDVVTDAGDQHFKRQQYGKEPEDQETCLDPIPIAELKRLLLSQRDGGSRTTDAERNELSNNIYKVLQASGIPKEKGFIPKAQLDKLINRKAVLKELRFSSIPRESWQQWSRVICSDDEVVLEDGRTKISSFRKIFALLVLIQDPSAFPRFLEENISDLDLPLALEDFGDKQKLCRRAASGCASDKASPEPLRCCEDWSSATAVHFFDYQWTMLAPFFDQGEYNDVKHYVLDAHHVLPFVHRENAAEFGGFSRVLMVRIHPEHHNFQDAKRCDRGFAIKRLKKNDRRAFQQEVNILKKFSGSQSHAHIISLLATYEQLVTHQESDYFNLIFYRAEANLFQYWKMVQSRSELAYDDVKWFAQQCHGIADGLLHLHRHSTFGSSTPGSDDEGGGAPVGRHRMVKERGEDNKIRQYGRHGDIKPENILWYRDHDQDRGTLKISDFGTAELNSRFSKTKRPVTEAPNTLSYRPPERDVEGGAIRQESDAWSLGCVYLEFIAWMLGGFDLVKEFSERRPLDDPYMMSMGTDVFFHIKRGEDDELLVGVKATVTNFFDKLHGHDRCTEYFHIFLNMIQEGMLVVDPVDSSPSRRYPCEVVSQKLKKWSEQCCKEPDYATKPCKWLPSPPSIRLCSEPIKVASSAAKRKWRTGEILV